MVTSCIGSGQFVVAVPVVKSCCIGSGQFVVVVPVVTKCCIAVVNLF